MSEPNVMEPTVHIRARVWTERVPITDPKTGDKVMGIQERWAIQQLWSNGVNQQWRDLPIHREGLKNDDISDV